MFLDSSGVAVVHLDAGIDGKAAVGAVSEMLENGDVASLPAIELTLADEALDVVGRSRGGFEVEASNGQLRLLSVIETQKKRQAKHTWLGSGAS